MRVAFGLIALAAQVTVALACVTAQTTRLEVPVVGHGVTADTQPISLCSAPEFRKLYVGGLSRDQRRTGLRVYDLDDAKQPIGEPRVYSDHPDPLPPGHHSQVACLLLDAPRRKLYLGVRGSQPNHERSLVMVSLDPQGEPTGTLEAFDHGNPHKACDALAFHPRNNRLYAVGWGGEGVFILERDETGRPIGTPQWKKFGAYGGRSIAIHPDGKRLYRGTYPSVLEVCQLDQQGDIVQGPVAHAITNGAKEYLQFTATTRAIFFLDKSAGVNADAGAASSSKASALTQQLARFPLDENGDVRGGALVTHQRPVLAVAAATRQDHLLIAEPATFVDSLTSETKIQGTQLVEVQLDAQGAPGVITGRASVIPRAIATTLTGGAQAALAVKSLGNDFLGNRISGLKVRCSIVSLEADGEPLPATRTIPLGEEKVYLRFALSQKHRRVYALADDKLVDYRPSDMNPKAVQRVAAPNAAGPLVVDERRGLLFFARKDGQLEARELDADGHPSATGPLFPTSLVSVGTLLTHPVHDVVYAVGMSRDAKTVAELSLRKTETAAASFSTTVVSIGAGSHVSDAVIDATRGRIYVVGAYRGQENTSVWKITATGLPTGDAPTWLADAITTSGPNVRNVLASVRLDQTQRRLIVTGAPENGQGAEARIVIHSLNEQGDPHGQPRLFPSANSRGSSWSLAASPDGRTLFESGWGEAKIFVRRSSTAFEPASAESTATTPESAWNVGAQGKRQLELVEFAGKWLLLAGTFPSTLEVLSLSSPSTAEPGAQVEIAVGAASRKMGLMSQGEASDWMELDESLRNGRGRAIVRCSLLGAAVKRAVVRWELVRGSAESSTPVRTVDVPIVGNVAALIVPKYGLDDPEQLASQVRTSAEEFRGYLETARQTTLSSTERPEKLLVANGLIGIDSSEEALDAGLETLASLGHNTVQIWSWPGVSPSVIRAKAERHGFGRFRDAVYNPPTYFHYNVPLVETESLDRWAATFRDSAKRIGAAPDSLELLHMGDEPGWYFPGVTSEVANDPQRLEVFRNYLRGKGLKPADLGASTWEEVLPGRLSAAKTLAQRRLFFWTTRFYAESLSLAFAAATRAIERQVGPRTLTTTNLNNWPGRFYIPSPGKKIANNADAGPDAGMGMPDWFDLGRKRAVTCIWTEDWFGDSEAQLWSLYGDLLRCAAREGGVEYGGYPVGHSTGAFAAGGAYKIATLVGHGAKAIDPYIFGPNLAFADGWSEKEATYRNLAAGLKLIGQADRLLAPGRPRDGNIAIVFPQASQVWDEDARVPAYIWELYGLHFALKHENYSVDFVDDFGLEAGDLSKRQYSVVYVTAPNLSVRAQRALVDWVAKGGTVVLAPGACAADELNEPCIELRRWIGAQQGTVARVGPPHFSQATNLVRELVNFHPATAANSPAEPDRSFAVAELSPWSAVAQTTRVVAQLKDGRPAVVEAKHQQGRIIAFAYWPGIAYWLTPDRSNPRKLPQGWADEARKVITWPARLANTPRHVQVSEPGVEAIVLDSPRGMAVTLLNWTGKPLATLDLAIKTPANSKGTWGTVTSVTRGALEAQRNVADTLQLRLPLETVDILMLERND
jgi:hypothetical protein